MMRLAVLIAGVCALAACSGPSPDASPSASVSGASGRLTLPDTVVTYPRPFQADRLVEAQVYSSANVAAVEARLDSPLFADSPVRDSRVRLFPESDNRVRLPLGDPVCPAPAGDSFVVLTLDVGGKEVVETVAVADDAILRGINADECVAQAALDVATPSFGMVESQSPTELRTTIVLTRGESLPDQPVTLAGMTGNIVYIVTLEDEAQRTLAAGAETLAVPAVVTVGRCDPHVFAESKKTFVFPVRLAVGDAEPSYVEIQPDPIAKAALKQLFDDCGEAERGD